MVGPMGCLRTYWGEVSELVSLHLTTSFLLATACFCCCSFAQLFLTLCHPMDWSMPGFPVYHQPPELTQMHVQPVGDAIQPSYPLLSPSPPAFSLSQHQGLFQGVSSLHQVTKSASVPPMNIQDWFPLGWTDLISLQFKGLSRVFSNTTIQRHDFLF